MKRSDTRDARTALNSAGIRYERAYTDRRKTTGPRTKFYGIWTDQIATALDIIIGQFPGCRVRYAMSRGGVLSIVVWR